MLPGLPDAGSEVEPADGVGDAVPVGDELKREERRSVMSEI